MFIFKTTTESIVKPLQKLVVNLEKHMDAQTKAAQQYAEDAETSLFKQTQALGEVEKAKGIALNIRRILG